MEKDELDYFFISEYRILIENLNKISAVLLKAKWYFLAALAALGVGYSYIFHKTIYKLSIINNEIYFNKCYELPFTISIFILFIIGNIVFWLISEYAISHAFLFRYVQAKAAQKEIYFDIRIPDSKFKKNNIKFIKDPSNIKQFIKIIKGKKFLNIDFFIPDQFIPIYWASIWAIIINSVLSIYFIYKYNPENIIIFIIPFLALGFVFKIFGYFIYKMNKFLYNSCNYRIYLNKYFNNECKDFYSLPHILDYISCGLLISLLSLSLLVIINISLLFKIYIFIFISLFWIPILGLILHICKIFLQFVFWDIKGPLIQIERRNIIVFFDNSLIGTMKWIIYQLFTII